VNDALSRPPLHRLPLSAEQNIAQILQAYLSLIEVARHACVGRVGLRRSNFYICNRGSACSRRKREIPARPGLLERCRRGGIRHRLGPYSSAGYAGDIVDSSRESEGYSRGTPTRRRSGRLVHSPLSGMVATGSEAYSVATDPTGHYVYVANFPGSVSEYSIGDGCNSIIATVWSGGS